MSYRYQQTPDTASALFRRPFIRLRKRSVTMLPNPLHPGIVHFPVVLAFLLPLFAIGAMWAIRRGARPRRAWSIPFAIAVALAASAWGAVETGEAQDKRVERIVAEQPLSAHEEMAETFLAASAGLALIAAVGLVGGLAGRAARATAVIGSLGLVVGAALVGHSGGQLVYRYGAASAYTSEPTALSDSTRAAQVLARRVDGRNADDDSER
jgi:uncharacterized membrane protein